MTKIRTQKIQHQAVVALSVLEGNDIYWTDDLWGTTEFELAWSEWLLIEPECNGMRFLYKPKKRAPIELLVYQNKLWNTTSGEPEEVVVPRQRLHLIK